MSSRLLTFTISSLELSQPLQPLPMHGRQHALALARWHGRPVGWIWLSFAGPELDVSTLEREVGRQIQWPLVPAALADTRGSAPLSSPPISVVICTRNRPTLLERCLASFALLRYPDFEIIVVDNAPDDNATRAIASSFPVRYVREDRPGLDWARNRGIAQARHDIIAFTDDDATVDSGWLTGIAAGFQNAAVMAVTGFVAPMELATPAQVLFEHVYGGMGKGMSGRLFQRDQLRPSQLIAAYTMGVGANMAFRRAAFEQVGEFDTALDVGTPASGGGDLDMFHRVVAGGLPLWYEPRALVWHQHRQEIPELERQLYNDGRSFGVYLQKLWKNRTVPRRSLLRFTTWQWGRWLIGRLVLGMLGRHRMTLPLLRAPLRGALQSPAAYRATYQSDRRIREQFAQPSASAPDPLSVSIIIPAFNAAETIAEPLRSLMAQSHSHWEAIVVDDGSTDGTVAIAQEYAARDPRIRVIARSHEGLSLTRNAGLDAATFRWVLFLDADDWIQPTHLERMTGALAADPTLDAVHCGWAILSPDGQILEEGQGKAMDDLFPILARHPAFVIHACVVKRSLVQAAGGFDPAFDRIQDWVMWQRIARMGCRFGTVREKLAMYLMHPGSISADAENIFEQALRAIALGHQADPQVSSPLSRYAEGMPADELAEARLAFLGWPAGMMLARGEDAQALLGMVDPAHWPDLAAYLGEIIYSAAPRALGRHRSAWAEIWPQVGDKVDWFLAAAEQHASAPGLSRSVRCDLARRVLEDSTQPLPSTVALTHAVRLEVTRPLDDIFPPAGVERLWCSVELEGARIGTIELPVCGSVVPAVVLKDAVTDRFSWLILGRFFQQTTYREYEIRQEGDIWSAWQGGNAVARGTDHDNAGPLAALHDSIGWETLLRETWADERDEVAPVLRENGWIAIEVSAPLPALRHLDHETVIEVLVGGVSVGAFRIEPGKLVSADATRSVLSDLLGFEFCRAVVREALIGSLFDEPGLRARLRMKADQQRVARSDPAWPGLPLEWRNLIDSNASSAVTILGRHPHTPVGGSGSRRALLPGEAIDELAQAAAIDGQLTISNGNGHPPAFVAYVPEVANQPVVHLSLSDRPARDLASARRFDRHHFETSFARTTDPWSYSSDYENIKYEQTLEMIPGGPVARALELGCAEGHFTERLAPRVSHLIAADIADIALERSAERCRHQPNIEYRRLDLVTDAIPGNNDLVVCSEVLYYAGTETQLAEVASRIAESIQPGGHFVTAHANLVADEPDQTGFAWNVPYGAATIARVFGNVPSLRLVRELKTPLYRIQLYRRVEGTSDPDVTPQVREETNRALPAPEIAQWIRWEATDGPGPSSPAAAAATDQLPILMYHQVEENGAPARTRWRVTPQQFELQLKYLRDVGFYSVGLDAWRAAMGHRRALPGRAVLITFDDGYRDFATYAWPLLRRYGFSALVFLATEGVGGRNHWDPPATAGDALLDWDELRRLRDEGVMFGSHSLTHRRLTGLPPEEVVREAAASRAAIDRELEQTVSAFAYPYGDHDVAIQHLVGACGYEQGFTCQPGRARLHDSPLSQPRIEICGDDDLTAFIAKLG